MLCTGARFSSKFSGCSARKRDFFQIFGVLRAEARFASKFSGCFARKRDFLQIFLDAPHGTANAHIHTYIHTYTHAYIHIYIHTYIHTYTHTYIIHTYIHTHTHLHTRRHGVTTKAENFSTDSRADHTDLRTLFSQERQPRRSHQIPANRRNTCGQDLGWFVLLTFSEKTASQLTPEKSLCRRFCFSML